MRMSSKIRLIIIIASSAVLTAVCAILATERIIGIKADNVQEKTRALYNESPAQSATAVEPVIAEAEPETVEFAVKTAEEIAQEAKETPAEPVIPTIAEDMLELYAVNNDLAGWLKAGEKIDYPVVQGDNRYYLKHDFYKKRTSNGSVFLNDANSLWPRDDILLIHAHNMGSGAMFGTLKKFMKYKYLCTYPIVTFRTIYDEADVYYTPFAIFNASMHTDNREYFNLLRINFDDDPVDPNAVPRKPAEGETVRKSAEFSGYLDEVLALSEWQSRVDVNVDDTVIVLITCSYRQENGRMMLFCRQLRDGETPESIQALYADDLAELNKKK